jgi:Holliday junction resolvase
MAMTPEAKVKNKVVKLLKAAGVYYFYASTHGFGRSGVPDLVCCLKGKFVGIECKAGKNKPTPLQEKEMAAIRDAGGTTLVVNEENINDVEELINESGRGDTAI